MKRRAKSSFQRFCLLFNSSEFISVRLSECQIIGMPSLLSVNLGPLPKFMHHMMSHVGGKTSALLIHYKTSWQDSYYDTRVRTAKQFQFVSCYIEQNPVVKGLVEKPDEWDASSANRKELVTDPWPWLLDE
jgi:hypothetical protein